MARLRMPEEERKRRKNAARNARYASDPEFARKAKEKSAAHRAQHPDKARASKAAAYAKSKERYRSKRASYYVAHGETIKQKTKAYRAANPEKARATVRACHENNGELYRARKREYNKRNAAHINAKSRRWYTENQDRAKRNVSRWRARNPEKASIHGLNSRLKRKAGQSGSLSSGLTKRLLRLQRGRCACCACDLAVSGHHRDHIEPLARGGRHEDSNIQLLCPRCNLSKHAKPPIEFMQSRGFLL